jgi:hypothetical protein
MCNLLQAICVAVLNRTSFSWSGPVWALQCFMTELLREHRLGQKKRFTMLFTCDRLRAQHLLAFLSPYGGPYLSHTLIKIQKLSTTLESSLVATSSQSPLTPPPAHTETTTVLFLAGLGFELVALPLQSRCSNGWATPPFHFALITLEGGVSKTICSGWPQISILLISASQAARIIGVSHWHLAK